MKMIGQYTEDEMKKMCPEATLKSFVDGHIIRRRGNTVNYYCRESDNSWTNYDCKTVYSR